MKRGDAMADQTADRSEERGVRAASGVDWISWGLVALLGVIWGASFSFTSVAVQDLPPISVAAARLAIGALILVPLSYLLADGLPAPRGAEGRRIWLFALGAAFFSNAAPFSLLSWAQTEHVQSGLAAIFMSATPLIVLPLAAWLVPGERMTLTKTIGFAIGVAGVAVLVGADALGGIGGGWIEIVAQLACLGAASGYAIGSVLLKRAPATHPLGFAALTLIFAAMMAAPIALLSERPFDAAWSLKSGLAILYLGVLPTAIAMVLLLKVIKRAGPTFLSLVNYQVPIWGMTFGVLFLEETAPEAAPLALVIILTGVAIAQGAGRVVMRRIRRANQSAPSL